MFKAILTILIWIMIAGIASAVQDPFLVYGYVKYDNGSVVDGANVNISVPEQALAETTNSMGKYIGVLDRYQDGDEIIVTTVKGLYSGSAADILDKSSGGLMINVTITVNNVNNIPVITGFEPADGSEFNETDILNIDITATDADGQVLSYSIKIDGVTKSLSPGYAWGTNYSSAGAHTIDIIVSDGTDQVTDQHIVLINNIHPRWDVNEDLEVNILDITLIGQKYGTSLEAPYPRWDVNQDGVVNVQDLIITGYYFGETVT